MSTAGWEASQCVLRFFRDYDTWHYDRMVEAFLPDGVWERAGKRMQGRAAMLEELKRRPENQLVRHVVTNVVVEQPDAQRALVTFLITAYRHMGDRAPAAPPTLKSPLFVLDGDAELRLEGGRWMFHRQALRRVFEFED